MPRSEPPTERPLQHLIGGDDGGAGAARPPRHRRRRREPDDISRGHDAVDDSVAAAALRARRRIRLQRGLRRDARRATARATRARSRAPLFGRGKNGGALSFDGIDDSVTVADANDLDLTNGMALSAWVRPSGAGADWQTVLLKESIPILSSMSLQRHRHERPSRHVIIGGDLDVRGTARLAAGSRPSRGPLRRRHLQLYVNGGLVATRARRSMSASTGVLRIGGNATWAGCFAASSTTSGLHPRALTGGDPDR